MCSQLTGTSSHCRELLHWLKMLLLGVLVMVHLLLILLWCLVLFYLPLDVDIHEFLLARIQLRQEFALENFLRIEGREGKHSEDLYQAKDTTFTHIGICVVDHINEVSC